MKQVKRFRTVISAIGVLLLVQTGRGMNGVCQYYAQWSKGIPADSTFFPISMAGNAPHTAAAMAQAGVNIFIGGGDAATMMYMRSNNIKLICEQDDNTLSASIQNAFGATIVGWSQMDEPDNAQTGGSCVNPTVVQQLYATWKNNDPTRPVYLNLGQGVSNFAWIGRGSCTGNLTMYPQYIQGCDIVAFDIYPVSHETGVINGSLWYLAKGADSLRSWGNDRKPAWVWIECTQVGTDGPCPTPKQVRGLVWESLVHGAKGIQYFAPKLPNQTGADYNGVLNDPVMLPAITALNRRILSLAPVLNSDDLTGRVTVSSSNSAVPVDILVKSWNGGLYIFAAAMRSGTTTATFTVTSPPQTTATVLDEDRTLTLASGRFGDTFTGYDVHLYQIGGVISAVKDAYRPPASDHPLLVISPNPFAGATSVLVQNTGVLPAEVGVYRLNGVRIRTLPLNGTIAAWDGRDGTGKQMKEGVYIVKIITARGFQARPVMLVQ